MLWQEAEAWRSLHQLHGVCEKAAIETSEEALADSDELRVVREDSSECKEASYIASLSALASHLDGMATEVLKLRDVRRLRRSAEKTLLHKALRSHNEEVLAMGQKLSTQCGLSVSNLTADLRIATQRQRNQTTLVMQALEACQRCDPVGGVAGSSLLVGLRADGVDTVRTADEFASMVQQEGGEVNTRTVSAALRKIREGAALPPPCPPVSGRSFKRSSLAGGGGDAVFCAQQTPGPCSSRSQGEEVGTGGSSL